MVSNSSTAFWGFFMGQQPSSKDKPEAVETEPTAAVPAIETAAVTPKMALAPIEQPKLDPPAIEAAATVPSMVEPAAVEAPVIEMSPIETLRIEPTLDLPKVELASIEAPRIAPEIDEIKTAARDDAAAAVDADETAPEASAGIMAPRFNRFTMLAASLVLAAVFGGMAGAVGAYGLLQPAASAAVAGRVGIEDIQALKENILQARVELAAIKVSLDAGNRSSSAQFTRIGERIERIERVQAEPTSKLNKAIETLDRIARADAAAQRDVTGSITAPQTVGGAPANAGVVDGWVVREVHRNTALLEGRMGLIEVDKGDVVPGLGRIEAMRKQDGRWVVVTTKGLIMSAR